jgi:hypothetical protein
MSMPSFMISNRAVIPAFNTVTALQSWLRPGLFAYIIGTHAEALRPHAVRLFGERNAMVDETALKYPETAEDGTPHPKAGQNVTTIHASGAEVTLFKSSEAMQDFKDRESALMNAMTTLIVDERLTLDHIKSIDKERLDAPRAMNGQSPSADAIDFAALLPLMASYVYDSNGIVIPAKDNGANRVASLVPST